MPAISEKGRFFGKISRAVSFLLDGPLIEDSTAQRILAGNITPDDRQGFKNKEIESLAAAQSFSTARSGFDSPMDHMRFMEDIRTIRDLPDDVVDQRLQRSVREELERASKRHR